MKGRRVFTGLGVVAVVMVLLLTAAGSVSALEERTGQTVVIEAGEVINDDLVVSAEDFVLNGTVKGDIMGPGGTLTIGPTGVVEEDLMAAGREVVIQGTVKDDVPIAGAALKVDGGAQISDDLMGAGYSLETAPGSTIGGSLFFLGSQALLGGEVKENATAVSIPYLGIVISIVATVFGLGALWLLARERLQGPKAETAGGPPS